MEIMAVCVCRPQACSSAKSMTTVGVLHLKFKFNVICQVIVAVGFSPCSVSIRLQSFDVL